MTTDFFQCVKRWTLLVAAASLMAACATGTSGETPTKNVSTPSQRAQPASHGLTIYGYNYTDLYIDSFEVGGNGGGNLSVSTMTTGGSKSACCASVYPALVPYEVKIKWKGREGKNRWCEKKVTLHGPIPAKPGYFEVHFYPDGHIEVAVTEDASKPRLTLERFSYGRRKETGNKVYDEMVGECKDGY